MSETLDKALLSALERFKNGQASDVDLRIISQALASGQIQITPSIDAKILRQSGGTSFGESNEIHVSGSVIGTQRITGFTAGQVLEILELKESQKEEKTKIPIPIIVAIIAAIATIVTGYLGFRGPIEAAFIPIRVSQTAEAKTEQAIIFGMESSLTPTVHTLTVPPATASASSIETASQTPVAPSPTNTPLAPSHTPIPPSNTPVPPSDTPIPTPTDTLVPEFINERVVADADNYWTEGPAAGVSSWDCNGIGHPTETVLRLANQASESLEILCRSLVGLSFPLYTIPREANIVSATLNLYLVNSVDRPLDPWHEVVILPAPQPFREDSYISMGYCSGNDFSDSFIVDDVIGWQNWDITDHIRRLHGDELIDDQICMELGNGVGWREFVSREGQEELRPYLEIIYRP